MIGIVTGIGPRTGTSFTMLKLKEAGVPIKGYKNLDTYTVPEKNPNGYWELLPHDLLDMYKDGRANNHVMKVWPVLFDYINPKDVACIVVLQRKNTDIQKQSIESLVIEEKKLPRWEGINMPPAEKIISIYKNETELFLNKINKDKVLNVYTEELNNEVENIISFFKRSLTWAQ